MDDNDNDNICCGTCANFLYEDINGFGICAYHRIEYQCWEVCDNYQQLLGNKPGHICSKCYWYAELEGICCNGDSEYCAEFVPHWTKDCEHFKPEDDEPAV